MKISRWILFACMQVALLAGVSAAVNEAPFITRVLIQQAPDPGSSTYVNNLSPRRLNKFVNDNGMVSLRCDVELKSSALPPDSWIVLDYRLPGAAEAHSLRVSAGDVGAENRTATFLMPVPAGVDGSAIAWRARVVRDDQVLTERKSTLWR